MRGGDHVVPFDDLLAFAAFGLAEGALVGVEVVPAFPGGRVDVLGGEQVQDVLGVALTRKDFGAGPESMPNVVESSARQ